MLEQADTLHTRGEIEKGIEVLVTLQHELPNTPEATEARKRELAWSVERAGAIPRDDRATRRIWIDRALKLGPTSVEAKIEKCTLVRDEGGMRALERCLDNELADPAASTAAAAVSLRAELEADKSARRAHRERLEMLRRPEESSWTALVNKYPSSEEAERANRKLAWYGSICHDRERVFDRLRDEVRWQSSLTQRFRAVSGATQKVKVFYAIRGEMEEHRKSLDAHRARVESHRISEGESGVRDKLARLPVSVIKLYDNVLKHAEDFTTGATYIVDIEETFAPALKSTLDTAWEETTAECAKLPSSGEGPGPDIVVEWSMRLDVHDEQSRKLAIAMKPCAQAARARRPTLEGYLSLAAIVQHDGSLIYPEVFDTNLIDDELVKCAVRELEQLKLGATLHTSELFVDVDIDPNGTVNPRLADKQASGKGK